MIFDLLTVFVLGVAALLVILAVIAPFESLGWWAGWFGEQVPPTPANWHGQAAAAPTEENTDRHFLVYMSGIGAIDPIDVVPGESAWTALARERIPQTTVITDVFPFSVTNTALTAERLFKFIWLFLGRSRARYPNLMVHQFINARNLFQLMISADHRYGPIYSLGVANEIVRSLERHGYRVGSGTPVTLMGYSGGAQVSLGACSFLRVRLQAPLRIISIGGFLSDDVGIRAVHKLYHLQGRRDMLPTLSALMYAGRWSVVQTSYWNQARRDGKIVYVDMGAMAHRGPTGYFSLETRTPAGQYFGEVLLDEIVSILVREGVVDAPAGARVLTDEHIPLLVGDR